MTSSTVYMCYWLNSYPGKGGREGREGREGRRESEKEGESEGWSDFEKK